MESTIYKVNGKEFELCHHGVKGMKWGKRKAKPESTGTGKRGSQDGGDQTDAEAKKKARRKKILIAGAAVVGTALAAYGAKKASDVMKDKAFKKAHERGERAIKKYMDKQFLQKTRLVYDDKNALMKTLDSLDGEFRRLSMENDQYAKRASKNTISAAKELLGKNYELPLATLKLLGINKFDPR